MCEGTPKGTVEIDQTNKPPVLLHFLAPVLHIELFGGIAILAKAQRTWQRIGEIPTHKIVMNRQQLRTSMSFRILRIILPIVHLS